MLLSYLTLIMAIKTGPGTASRRVTGSTLAARAAVIHRKTVVEICWFPGVGGMTIRALSIVVIGWAAIAVTGDTIRRASCAVVECGRFPGSRRMAG